MEKLLLVDGSNLLFQMFYGMPSRFRAADGRYFQGTMGFTGALLKIIRRVEPAFVLVVFDGEHENPRTGVNADYKANRPGFSDVPDEDNPFSQLPDIYQALDYLGIRHMETVDCETDDIIAGYCFRFQGKADFQIIISSFDSDFLQLVSPSVSVLRYRGEKTVICTEAYVDEKFGVSPFQYADFKSLTGDTADNIRGAVNVGPKTAAALLKEFGTLEQLLEREGEIKNQRIRKSIQESHRRLGENYSIIRLQPQDRLPFGLEELRFCSRETRTREVMEAIGLYFSK